LHEGVQCACASVPNSTFVPPTHLRAGEFYGLLWALRHPLEAYLYFVRNSC
jgi:hypothetical protein